MKKIILFLALSFSNPALAHDRNYQDRDFIASIIIDSLFRDAYRQDHESDRRMNRRTQRRESCYTVRRVDRYGYVTYQEYCR